jgi:hypothetical protein
MNFPSMFGAVGVVVGMLVVIALAFGVFYLLSFFG